MKDALIFRDAQTKKGAPEKTDAPCENSPINHSPIFTFHERRVTGPGLRLTLHEIRFTLHLTAACAAASLAIGTLNGEQET